MYLLGCGAGALAGDDVALPGGSIIFTKYFYVHLLPKHTGHFRAVFPEEEVGNHTAGFSRPHTHDVFAVEIGCRGENFR